MEWINDFEFRVGNKIYHITNPQWIKNLLEQFGKDDMKKTHHNPDYAKDKTADVIKKGSGRAVPNEQWQKNMDLTPKGSSDGYGAFNPRPGKDRPTVYPKTNECDH